MAPDFGSRLSFSLFSADTGKLHAILSRCNIPFSERKLKDMKTDSLEQDLGRLVGGLERHLSEIEKKHAMAARTFRCPFPLPLPLHSIVECSAPTGVACDADQWRV
jgi:hypothetical protein